MAGVTCRNRKQSVRETWRAASLGFPHLNLSPSCWESFAAFWSKSDFLAYETVPQNASLFLRPLPRRCPGLLLPPPPPLRCCSAGPSWREQTRLRPLRQSSGPAGGPDSCETERRSAKTQSKAETPNRRQTATHSCFLMRDDTSWADFLLELLGVVVTGSIGESSWSTSALSASHDHTSQMLDRIIFTGKHVGSVQSNQLSDR